MKEGHAFPGMNLAALERARNLTALAPPLPVDALHGLQALVDGAIGFCSEEPGIGQDRSDPGPSNPTPGPEFEGHEDSENGRNRPRSETEAPEMPPARARRRIADDSSTLAQDAPMEIESSDTGARRVIISLMEDDPTSPGTHWQPPYGL